jgi:hypothetical protein
VSTGFQFSGHASLLRIPVTPGQKNTNYISCRDKEKKRQPLVRFPPAYNLVPALEENITTRDSVINKRYKLNILLNGIKIELKHAQCSTKMIISPHRPGV